MTLLRFVFWSFAGLGVLAALLCVTRRDAVKSAIWLVVTLFSLAVLFAVLDAQFLAVMQVLVYAGAIMVLFLFVIMLLNLGRGGPGDAKGPLGILVGVILGGLLLVQLTSLTKASVATGAALPPGTVAALQQQQGAVGMVARPLFDTYLIPFEITSVLLLAAVVGAVVLAKRKL
ncbi:MAG TPA: NADH-quinone oxidoreductase subunit J [Gemmatimonadales bacterium]|nr:NADH-quinone oxidoreductase subunit J [Gemmatimonadales bacterium]